MTRFWHEDGQFVTRIGDKVVKLRLNFTVYSVHMRYLPSPFEKVTLHLAGSLFNPRTGEQVHCEYITFTDYYDQRYIQIDRLSLVLIERIKNLQ